MYFWGQDGAAPSIDGHIVGEVVLSIKADGEYADGWIWDGEKWMACSGSLSRADHPRLYAVIADTFGAAPEGEFRLPQITERPFFQEL